MHKLYISAAMVTNPPLSRVASTYHFMQLLGDIVASPTECHWHNGSSEVDLNQEREPRVSNSFSHGEDSSGNSCSHDGKGAGCVPKLVSFTFVC